MPPKARRLQDLSDDELEAERKRRRAASRPQKVRVVEMTEEQYKRLLKEEAGETDENDEGEDGDDDDDDDKGGSRYFG